MTSYNTVRFSLEEMEFTLRGDKSPEQLQRIADLVCQNAAQLKAMTPNYPPVRLVTLTALNLAEELLDAREEISQLLEEAAAANRANPRRRRTPRQEKAGDEYEGDVLFAGRPEPEGEALFPLSPDPSAAGFFTRLSALPGVGLNPAPAKEEQLCDGASEYAASLFPEEEPETDNVDETQVIRRPERKRRLRSFDQPVAEEPKIQEPAEEDDIDSDFEDLDI